MKRHVNLHRARKVDSDALRMFREAGITDIEEGQKLEFKVEDIAEDVETIRKFVEKTKQLVY